MFDDAVILITGGTGSFGKKYTKTLLERYSPRKITIYSRDELKQFEMQRPRCARAQPDSALHIVAQRTTTLVQ